MLHLIRALLRLVRRPRPGRCRQCGAPALAEFRRGELLCGPCAVAVETAERGPR